LILPSRFLLSLLVSILPGTAFAQAVDVLGNRVERRAAGALAVLGISAVPSETASALAFDTGSEPGGGTDFRADQLGCGFTRSEATPIYLERDIGWSGYHPVFVFSNGVDQASTSAKWTSIAATGGIGWDFALTENLTFRPILYLTLGEIVSDATLAAQFIADRLGSDARFILDGALRAGGVGAARYSTTTAAGPTTMKSTSSCATLMCTWGQSAATATSSEVPRRS
jgi:hypothetical protein